MKDSLPGFDTQVLWKSTKEKCHDKHKRFSGALFFYKDL